MSPSFALTQKVSLAQSPRGVVCKVVLRAEKEEEVSDLPTSGELRVALC